MEYKVIELTEQILEKDLDGFFEAVSNLRPVGNIDYEDAKKILIKINSQDSHIFVAIDENDKIVATTTLMIEQKFLRNGALAGHIEDVSTRKGFEKKGLASAVLKYAIAYAKKRGCYKVILDCEENLINFYSRFELKDEGTFMALRF